jgi:hypothetical protein
MTLYAAVMESAGFAVYRITFVWVLPKVEQQISPSGSEITRTYITPL